MEQSKFYQIKNVTEREYTLVGCDGSVITRPIQDVDKSASAFTIQDAKDGDVLMMQKTDVTYESIFIFNKIENNRIIQYFHYFTTDADEEVCEARSIDGFLGFVGTTVHPATKEQRGLLFQKMKEAGYEWNAGKKELKKIENEPENYKYQVMSEMTDLVKDYIRQKPVWSEEDEKQARQIERIVHDDGCTQKLQKQIADWLKSLKDRVQPKQEWSQNDIDMIDWLIRCCEKEHEELCNDKYGHQDIVSDLKRDCRKKWDWLESLKNRVAPQKQWKPSKEQIEALEHSLGDYNIKIFEDRYEMLKSLYNELKELKE